MIELSFIHYHSGMRGQIVNKGMTGLVEGFLVHLNDGAHLCVVKHGHSFLTVSPSEAHRSIRSVSSRQLQQNDFSTRDLFQWHLLVEIIDAYERFCPSIVDQDRTRFCNFFGLHWVGPSCECSFETTTMYVGLKCIACEWELNWRQIYHGLIDCENGDDERHCLTL